MLDSVECRDGKERDEAVRAPVLAGAGVPIAEHVSGEAAAMP